MKRPPWATTCRLPPPASAARRVPAPKRAWGGGGGGGTHVMSGVPRTQRGGRTHPAAPPVLAPLGPGQQLPGAAVWRPRSRPPPQTLRGDPCLRRELRDHGGRRATHSPRGTCCGCPKAACPPRGAEWSRREPPERGAAAGRDDTPGRAPASDGGCSSGRVTQPGALTQDPPPPPLPWRPPVLLLPPAQRRGSAGDTWPPLPSRPRCTGRHPRACAPVTPPDPHPAGRDAPRGEEPPSLPPAAPRHRQTSRSPPPPPPPLPWHMAPWG